MYGGMRIDMRTGMYKHMYTRVCIDVRTGMCIDVRIDYRMIMAYLWPK